MLKNMGLADRVLRVSLTLVVGVLYLLGKISGLTAAALGLAAVAFLVTGFVGTCPIYLPFRLSTRGKASMKEEDTER